MEVVNGILIIVFLLTIFLVGVPVGIVIVTSYEKKAIGLLKSPWFFPANVGLALLWCLLGKYLGSAFYVLVPINVLALLIWGVLKQFGRL